MLALGVALAGLSAVFPAGSRANPAPPPRRTEQQRVPEGERPLLGRFPQRYQTAAADRDARGGATYRLFGFRSGDEICLRLVAERNQGGPE